MTDEVKEAEYLLNPMSQIGQSNVTVAPHWYIRHGSIDRDTAFPVALNLATKLENEGKDVNFLLAWNRPHSGDYALNELFDWLDKLVKSITSPQLELKPGVAGLAFPATILQLCHSGTTRSLGPCVLRRPPGCHSFFYGILQGKKKHCSLWTTLHTHSFGAPHQLNLPNHYVKARCALAT